MTKNDPDEERICGRCCTVVPAATVDADGDCEDCQELKALEDAEDSA